MSEQEIPSEEPDAFQDPPMRWNTGLLQYEVDLDHEAEGPPPEGRPWLSWALIALLVLPLLILLVYILVR